MSDIISKLNHWVDNEINKVDLEDKINKLREESEEFRSLEFQLEYAKQIKNEDLVDVAVNEIWSQFQIIMS
tara:strand:- start:3933 stop:4145 length:213 start_codon:yes stop_codon:yes gene_type:complete